MTKPFVVGLTGGIGSGKTAATNAFATLGIDIIDADLVAREVVAPGSEGLQAIVEHFGASILTTENTLDRAALREKIFNNDAEKAWLNDCLHPKIRVTMNEGVTRSTSPYCILSAPLLIENKLQKMVDHIVVVDCSEETQIARAMARDNNNRTLIENIMKSQVPRSIRLQAADDILDNGGTLDQLVEQVNSLHKKLLDLANQE